MHVHAMRAYARGRGPLLPLGVVDLVKESCFTFVLTAYLIDTPQHLWVKAQFAA